MTVKDAADIKIYLNSERRLSLLSGILPRIVNHG